MSFVPTVLCPLSLPGLLNYILTTQSDTTFTVLVVCSSRDSFLEHLSESLQQDQRDSELDQLKLVIEPKLRNLFTARNINVAFCPSVQALLAYLATYHERESTSAHTTQQQRLVLVNPLTLHAPTPSFSAQGLSRTFATAAETALRTGAMLHLVECLGGPKAQEQQEEEEEEEEEEYEDVDMETRDKPGENTADEEDPWEQHVSILNVSARRFGSGTGERAWAGRTIKAKRIASRWFRFHRLEQSDLRHEGPE